MMPYILSNCIVVLIINWLFTVENIRKYYRAMLRMIGILAKDHFIN